MISQTKTLNIKSFLPFNCAIPKICVGIRLVRMEQEWTAYSFDYSLVLNRKKMLQKNITVTFRGPFVSLCLSYTNFT